MNDYFCGYIQKNSTQLEQLKNPIGKSQNRGYIIHKHVNVHSLSWLGWCMPFHEKCQVKTSLMGPQYMNDYFYGLSKN